MVKVAVPEGTVITIGDQPAPAAGSPRRK